MNTLILLILSAMPHTPCINPHSPSELCIWDGNPQTILWRDPITNSTPTTGTIPVPIAPGTLWSGSTETVPYVGESFNFTVTPSMSVVTTTGSAITVLHENGKSLCRMDTNGHWTFAPGETARSCKDAIVQYSPGKKERI
jgi:hypothetical protein